jgi:arsenite-transporting ATPase
MFYAGKGGVGKTTCATARAVAAAVAGRRILAVSTDPAHSIGDVLGTRLSSRPRRVRLSGARTRGGALFAAEIDARRAFARWLNAHRLALGDIVERGTWLDREDVNALLNLSIPGIDELVGLIEIARLSHAGQYDAVVVDTAPTGHALRLLAAPETVASLARVLDALHEEHRLIRDQLARVGRVESADRLIDLLGRQASETGTLLRDAGRTAFHWITLPEEMSLAETADGIETLERAGIHVSGIIANRVIPDGPSCPICDRRRLGERRALDLISRRFGARRTVYVVAAEISEPRGIRALARMGSGLLPDARMSSLHRRPRRVRPASRMRQPRGSAFSIPSNLATTPPESLKLFRNATLLFFGGKGGVGKTTAAATVALRLADAEPGRAVLLLSTDPAHSLGDLFGEPVGNRPGLLRRGPRNLYVRELDAAAALASRRAGIEAALNEIGRAFGAPELSSITEGRGAAELMELAPPGIDELFGLISVVESRDDYPLIVMDTAPTGHALRLLEMPDAAREWVQVLLRVLLKYRSLVRPGKLASELVDLSKSIRRLQVLLRNRRDTRFIVVTRAAAVPRIETGRLLGRLNRLRLSAPAVVVNAMTLSPGRCPRCRATATAEQEELELLGARCGQCVIIQTPLAAPPPRGTVALNRWSGAWIVNDHRRDR